MNKILTRDKIRRLRCRLKKDRFAQIFQYQVIPEIHPCMLMKVVFEWIPGKESLESISSSVVVEVLVGHQPRMGEDGEVSAPI